MDQQDHGKRMLSVRVGHNGYRHIADRAQRADVTVSHMHRRMLAYAALHMPEDWIPGRARVREIWASAGERGAS